MNKKLIQSIEIVNYKEWEKIEQERKKHGVYRRGWIVSIFDTDQTVSEKFHFVWREKRLAEGKNQLGSSWRMIDRAKSTTVLFHSVCD